MKRSSEENLGNLSRRQFGGVAGGLALGGAALGSWLSSASHLLAQEPKPMQDSYSIPKGLFATEFGAYNIYVIMDGMIPMKRGLFSGDESAITEVLENTGQTGETIPSPISAFLLKSKDKNILIDSGLGDKGLMGPGFGHLASGLAAAQTKPEDIDLVIVTHAHPDHIGGLLDPAGKVVFPNAEVVINEKEVNFWTDAAVMAKIPKEKQAPFDLAQKTIKAYGDQLTQVQSGKEVAAGIVMHLAAGHTPGHSIMHIDGGGSDEILMIADTLHNTELHTALPDIQFAFDVDSSQAAKTRRKIFDQLASDKSLALCSHAHFSGLGRILKNGDAYRYSVASL